MSCLSVWSVSQFSGVVQLIEASNGLINKGLAAHWRADIECTVFRLAIFLGSQ
jgi:hypothetical protein